VWFKITSLFVSQGTIWNEETLYLWLEKPQRYIQGTKMDFEGLPNPQDRVDVIEYLKEATGPPVHTNERGQAAGRYGNHG
jgi:cytochrome c